MNENEPNPFARDEINTVAPERETTIVQLLLKCGLFLQREMNRVCVQFGLKQQQFAVLNEIVWQGPISQKDLVRRLLFEKSNVSKIVRMLSEKDLIKVAVAPGDRRQSLLYETPAGVALWRDCMRAFHVTSAEFVSFLSETEVAQSIRLLKNLQRAFKNN